MADHGLLENEAQLDTELSRPGEKLVESARAWKGPLVILGAGGKMGPTLAVMAERAMQQAGNAREVWAISRFSDARTQSWLKMRGVRTMKSDLLHDDLRTLPDATNVIYLVGLK